MSDSVSVRIDENNLFEIDKISKIEKKNKSETLRDILSIGIKEKKLEIAIKSFIEYKVTIAKAAQIADLPLSTFMEILSERNISFHYGLKELEEDFEGL